MKQLSLILALLSLLGSSFAQTSTFPERIRVSSLGRYFVTQTGQPFFMLADTNWALFNLMSRDQVVQYLQDRKEKGFNTIQSTLVISGILPNAERVYPFEFLKPEAASDNQKGYDFSKPIEAYWKGVDFVVNEANRMGLHMNLVVAWNNHLGGPNGPKVEQQWSEEKARTYGQFLARRYATKRVLWVLGGDDRLDAECDCSKGSDRSSWWAAMAKGIKEATSFALVGFLPSSGQASSDAVKEATWLSFYGQQSGANAGEYNSLIAKDYGRTPTRPVLDLLPIFEDQPFWDPKANGWSKQRPSDLELRRIHYWNVFSGAAGAVFGHLAVAYHHGDGKDQYPGSPSMSWQEGLNTTTAAQMGYLGKLMNSRPFSEARPDLSLVQDSKGAGQGTVVALVGRDFALIYLPNPRSLKLDVSRFGPSQGWWFNPKNGQSVSIGSLNGSVTIKPAEFGPDAVLVIDQASKNYEAPGK